MRTKRATKSEWLNLRLTPALKERLQVLADREDRSVSYLVARELEKAAARLERKR